MSSAPLKRWLRGWIPGSFSPRRRVRIPVVADLGDRAEVWTLEVRGSKDGSGGLVPDSRMSITPDAAFGQAVSDAYSWAQARESFPRRAAPQWTVTWCLLDDTGTPASGEINGGSLGAAFGIAVAYLFGLGVPATRRLDPNALVSAGLNVNGHLVTVGGLETKVRALGERRARLLVAEPDRAIALDIRTGDHPAIGSGDKAADALSYARAPRYKSVPTLLITLIVVAVIVAWSVNQNAKAAEAEQTRLAQQLAGTSRQNLSGDPAAAALAAVAAATLRPDEPAAQAGLINAATVDIRFDGVIVQHSSTMTLSPDGAIVASGGEDHSVTLTKSDHSRNEQSARAGGGRVVAMTFADDGSVLITGDERGTIVRWDVATLTPTTLYTPDSYSPGPIRAIAADTNGTTIAFVDQLGRIFLHIRGGTISPYGLQAGATITTLAFTSPDTLVVAAVGRRGTQQLSTISTARPDLPPHELLPTTTSTFVSGVTALAVSGDGRTFVTGDAAGSVALWDAGTLTKRKSLSVERGVVGIHADTGADTALITTTGSLGFSSTVELEVGKAKTQLWDLREDKPRSAPFGGDFRTALVAADRQLRSAAVRGTDGGVTWWTDLDGDRMRQDGIVVDVLPDPRHTTSVVTAGMQGRVDFIDAATGRITNSLSKAGPEPLYGLAIDRTGQLLATAHADGTVLLRDRDSGAVRGSPLKASDEVVYRVAFSPTADVVATGSGDGAVRLWDTSTGKRLREWTTGANIVHQIMFNATGTRLYVADSRVTDLEVEGGLWWVSTDSDEIHDQQTIPYAARGMTLTTDGTVLVGTGDGTLMLTDNRLQPLPKTIPVRHRLNVLALAYSVTARRVVSAGSDNTFNVLRADDLSLMVELPGIDADLTGDDRNANGLYSIAVTQDGRFAVVGGHGGRVQVIPLASDLLIDRACHLAGRTATGSDLGITQNVLDGLGAPC